MIRLFVFLFLLAGSGLSFAQNEIPLWPGTAANGQGTTSNGPNAAPDGPGPAGPETVSAKGSHTNISTPRLILHLPSQPNGIAMLVISGGGYAHIECGNESGPAAEWLSSQGITAFELVYRLPAEGWSTTEVPFQDGQRAMRMIRSLAKKYGYDAHRIGIMGFSAGGHLAGITATEPDKPRYALHDDIDRLSAKPDCLVLLYPVLTMLPPYDNTHSEKEILGKDPSLAQQTAWSVEQQVTQQTPPTFLAQAIDDPISNVANSRLMYAALQQKQVPAEIHLFASGGHGWGMGRPGSPTREWPQLFAAWLQTTMPPRTAERHQSIR